MARKNKRPPNRPQAVEEEIRSLPAFTATGEEIADHLRRSVHHPETVVYVLREAIDRIRADIYTRCVPLLWDRSGSDRRIERLIRWVARTHGVSDSWELVKDRAADRALEKIGEGHEAEPFWEENFHHALKRVAQTEARTLKREGEHLLFIDPAKVDRLSDQSPSLAADAEIDQNARVELILSLPQPIARAAYYAWIEGRKQGPKSNPESVAGLMDCSDGYIRRLLREARALLADEPLFRDLRIEWEDHSELPEEPVQAQEDDERTSRGPSFHTDGG